MERTHKTLSVKVRSNKTANKFQADVKVSGRLLKVAKKVEFRGAPKIGGYYACAFNSI